MREFASPTTYVVPTTGNLTDDLLTNATADPDFRAFSRRQGDAWVDVTARQFLVEVRAVAKGLMAVGTGTGDRVALLCSTRFEWTLLDYALWYVGAVSVPLYPTSPAEQVARVLADSGATRALVETDEQRSVVPVARVWTIDGGGLDELVHAGRDVTDDDLERRRSSVTPDSLATLVYTSGTTGSPKGCMLSHGNFMTELGVAVEELDELFDGPDASTLLFLPLAHVFARVIQVGAVRARVRLGYSSGPRFLLGDLEQFRPTFLLAVPRVFENVFNHASQRAAADGRGRTFGRAVETAIAVSRSADSGGPGAALRLRHRLHDRLVYRQLRRALGGRCRYVVSGGAPLGERLGHFYRGIGVTVLEGWGLSETTAAVTVNLPDAAKIGTVGRPLHGCAVRVADDGELHVRGGQVFTGYWNDPEATDQVLLADGWLRTGDVGEIDDEGFVRVTGRQREILVTAGGKNVAPTVLEDRLRAHPLVSQCMVVGDGRPYVAALVTLDGEALAAWAGEHGRSGRTRDLVDDPDLRADIQAGVDQANAAVSQAEAIRRFSVLPTDWTEEGGHLTPSLKLRRSVVLHEFRAEVSALYDR